MFLNFRNHPLHWTALYCTELPFAALFSVFVLNILEACHGLIWLARTLFFNCSWDILSCKPKLPPTYSPSCTVLHWNFLHCSVLCHLNKNLDTCCGLFWLAKKTKIISGQVKSSEWVGHAQLSKWSCNFLTVSIYFLGYDYEIGKGVPSNL